MNKDNSSIISNPNENTRFIITPEILPAQNFPSLEALEDDSTLKDFLAVIKRRALVIISVVSLGMSTVIYSTLQAESVYQGNFQILVEPVNSESNSLNNILEENSPITASSNLDYESQIQVIRSKELIREILPKLQSSYPDLTYDLLIENLTIRRLGTTKIIEIAYQDHDRQKIDLVLNILSKFYLDYSLEKRKTKLNQGLQFIEKQLPAIRNRVAQLQQQLQIFRQRYNFIDPESQSGSIVQQLKTLQEERMKIDQELASARAIYVSLSTPEGQQATLNNAPIYSQLISQLRQLESQLSAELVRFQPDSPSIAVLEEKRQNLLPLIEDEQKRYIGLKIAEATTAIKKLEVQSQEIAQVEQQAQIKFQQIPVLTRQYTEIQRNLQLANESFNRFLATRETLAIEVAQTELPWELIQPPTQGASPILPNIPRNLLLGLLGSVAAGTAMAVLLEKLDNTYHNVTSLKEKIKLPLLGTLPVDKNLTANQSAYLAISDSESQLPRLQPEKPENKGLSRLLRHKTKGKNYYGQGLFWESLQVLYANIQMLNSDLPIRSLVVSSTMAGDGKTTTSFYLAQAAAALGKRVLLIDCDLRRPQIHNRSGLNNLLGLTNVLTSNIPLEEAIQKLPDMDMMSVITAGSPPPDPVRLLSSDKMKQLMTYCPENFDLVIYDAPPMLGLVDARLLAPQTDGMLLVMRMDKTDKSILMEFQDSLKHSPINILGVVANGDKENTRHYSYYYGSYYSASKQPHSS